MIGVLVSDTITYSCSGCRHVLHRVRATDPEWFEAQVRPCPICETAMTVTARVGGT